MGADAAAEHPTDLWSGLGDATRVPDSERPTWVDAVASPWARGDGCKRGVAYGRHSEADLRALSPAVTWWYNWATTPDPSLAAGAYRTLAVEYVPMVWGGTFDAATVAAQLPTDVRFLLGFNEPNFYAQANMSAQSAAAHWPDVEQIAKQRGLTLVSPAVNYCGGGCFDENPYAYLKAFFAACPGCRVDVVAFHTYVGLNRGSGNKAQWLINQVEQYKAQFTQPLWLTEFACDDATTLEEQRQFMVDAVAYLEAEPRIQRYAWFSGRADNMKNVDLLAADGTLSTLGTAYVEASRNPACSP
jgi:hypothetical protein